MKINSDYGRISNSELISMIADVLIESNTNVCAQSVNLQE